MSRSRSRDTRVYTGFTIVDTPGTTYSAPGNPYDYHGQLESIVDEVTPGYVQRIKQGEIIINPLSLYKHSRDDATSTLFFGIHPSWGSRQITGDFAGYARKWAEGQNLDPWPNDASNAAGNSLIKAYAKMNASPTLQGVNLIEMDQTLRMLRRPLGNAISLLTKMVRKREALLRTAKDFMKASAQTWLEYRYGWTPIILDAKAIAKEVHKLREPYEKSRLVARASIDLGAKLTKVQCSGALPGNCGGEYTYTAHKHVLVHSGVIYEQSAQTSNQRLKKVLGLRDQDAPITVWELVPWSFVVDWFVNVGEWIQAVTPNPSVTVKGSWTTTVTRTRDEVGPIRASLYVATPPATTYVSVAAGGDFTSETVVRASNPSLPLSPQLTSGSLSALHSIDGLALLVGSICKSLRTFRH